MQLIQYKSAFHFLISILLGINNVYLPLDFLLSFLPVTYSFGYALFELNEFLRKLSYVLVDQERGGFGNNKNTFFLMFY